MQALSRFGVALLCGLFVWGAASAASAQSPYTHTRFDVHLDLGYYSAAGAGFRVDLPIARRGIIDGVRDDLSFSLGADFLWFYHRDDGLGVIPLMALQWNFYVARKWSIFPELGVALIFAPNRQRFWGTFAAPFLGFGVRYHFNRRNALLFRINWPVGLQIGLTF